MAIFMDDFETGFVPWTSLAWWGSPVAVTEPVISTDFVHHGLHSLKCNVTAKPSYSVVKANIDPISSGYLRCLIRLNALPALNTEYVSLIELRVGGVSSDGVIARIVNKLGSWYWRLTTGEAGVGVNTDEAVPSVAVDTWYDLMVKRDINLNQQQLWVNGVSKAQGTQIQTRDSKEIVVGIGTNESNTAITGYFDCVVVDTSYIAPEIAFQPIVYPTVSEEQQTTAGSGAGETSSRVRTLRHTTPLSPWVTQ